MYKTHKGAIYLRPAESWCSAQRDSSPALITPFSGPHTAQRLPRLSPALRPAMSLIAKLCTANLSPKHPCAQLCTCSVLSWTLKCALIMRTVTFYIYSLCCVLLPCALRKYDGALGAVICSTVVSTPLLLDCSQCHLQFISQLLRGPQLISKVLYLWEELISKPPHLISEFGSGVQ